MTAKRLCILSQIIGWIILVIVVYPLSYAPMTRLELDWTKDHRAPSAVRSSIAYRPAMWLIDETAARKPLLAWSDYWGVELPHSYDSLMRCYELLPGEPARRRR